MLRFEWEWGVGYAAQGVAAGGILSANSDLFNKADQSRQSSKKFDLFNKALHPLKERVEFANDCGQDEIIQVNSGK
ncbi:hypothetical protein [Candidatus Erwinia dacicola]|uniref:hypothetical protein n=1 Tax=Candidatus Erwinia dacicola TaxID=252393 RepID=UPI0021C41482|nr:hypothetical protein [Candidatus Erwinia dacicola]